MRRVRNKEKHGNTMEMIKMRGRGKDTNNKARQAMGHVGESRR